MRIHMARHTNPATTRKSRNSNVEALVEVIERRRRLFWEPGQKDSQNSRADQHEHSSLEHHNDLQQILSANKTMNLNPGQRRGRSLLFDQRNLESHLL